MFFKTNDLPVHFRTSGIAAAFFCVLMLGGKAQAFDTQPASMPSLKHDVQYGDRRFDYGDRFKDNAGDWELLGKQKVGFLADRDVIRVGRQEGRYDKLALAVKGNDIELISMRVVYGNGDSEELAYREKLREGSYTRPIDLRGGDRIIREIQFIYRSKPSFQGQATLYVYGRQAGGGFGGGPGGPGGRPDRDAEGKRANCDTYAKIAVVQAEANDKYNCHLRGPEWNTNTRAHYEWCMFSKRDFLMDSLRWRAQELQKCFNNLGDYDDDRWDRGYRTRF